MERKVVHFMSIPWTGLGLYGGYRGDRWLRNRIKVFKATTLKSIEAQTNKNFIVWHAFRHEERNNPIVKQFAVDMGYRWEMTGIRHVFTFTGIPFWDDKYPDDVAKLRLVETLHGALQTLVNYCGEATEVLWTLQPSDDCYQSTHVDVVQKFMKEHPAVQVYEYTRGYIMDYTTGEISEYNPKTHPPFFTIRFPKDIFVDPFKHMTYTGPYKSHEYIGDKLKMYAVDTRGFLVGTHGENISTYYDHPYRGPRVFIDNNSFGLGEFQPLVIKKGLRRWILKKLPHPIRRKLRYWLGERLWAPIHNWIRR